MAAVTWTSDALGDLDAITAYIAQASPEFATEFARKIVDAARRLADFPLLGRRVPDLDIDSLRELVFQNYRIIYEPREDGVWIMVVMHSAMDFGTMAEQRGWNLS